MSILIIAVIAMMAAAVVNIILTESVKYCNFSNMTAYTEMTVAGSVLMFLSWIVSSQNENFDLKWVHVTAIVYASVFFLDVIETVRLTGSSNNDQRDICARLKKSSIVITILYFVFSYLIS